MKVRIYTAQEFGRILLAESFLYEETSVMQLEPCYRFTSDCEVEVEGELDGDLHFQIGTPNGVCSYAVLTQRHKMSPQTFKVCSNIVLPSVRVLLQLVVVPHKIGRR